MMKARYKFKALAVLLGGPRRLKSISEGLLSAYLFNFSLPLLGLIRI